MAVKTCRQIIIACFYYVRTIAVSIVGLKAFALNEDGDILRFAGLKLLCLCKAHKLNRCLLNTVFNVVIGIGLLKVNLNYVLTCCISYIFNGHRNVVAVINLLYLEACLLEGCVGKAIAEGICNGINVIVITNVFSAENYVLISCFIVSVSNVYTLGIYYVLIVMGVCLGCREPCSCSKGEITNIKRAGRRVIIVCIGVDKLTTGISLTRKHVCDLIIGNVAAEANPYASIEVVLTDVLHLHRISRVDKKNYLLEYAVSLKSHKLIKNFYFLIGKIKIIAVNTFARFEIRLVILTAVTGNNHNSCISILGEGRGNVADRGSIKLRPGNLLDSTLNIASITDRRTTKGHSKVRSIMSVLTGKHTVSTCKLGINLKSAIAACLGKRFGRGYGKMSTTRTDEQILCRADSEEGYF